MKRPAPIALLLLVVAIAGCAGLTNDPGKLTVTNNSTTETVVLTVSMADGQSSMNLAPGGSASVKTVVGGTYEVGVTLTGADQAAYVGKLQALRDTAEFLLGDNPTSDEVSGYMVQVQEIRNLIEAAKQNGVASCQGNMDLSLTEPVSTTASVSTSSIGGVTTYSMTCGSA